MSSPLEDQFAKDCAAVDKEWTTEVRPTLDAMGFFDFDLTAGGEND